MAIEYAKVLKELGAAPIVVGRGEASVSGFREATGLPAIGGGIEAWLQERKRDVPARAIVACGEKWIGSVGRQLLEAGVRRILLEKPGGFDADDIAQVRHLSRAKGAQVYVGYNRRFYASVEAARELIDADGGVTSFHFEFTEWSHVIAGLQKEEGVKSQWFLSNSTHVIDLAFHLGGLPDDWSAYTAGGLEWHPQASVFSGAGVTRNRALFSYQANWEAPGRWGLEVLTRKRRLIFRPLEKLQIQQIGSVAVTPFECADELDARFKPGLFKQTQAFLGGAQPSALPTIDHQLDLLPFYLRMRGDRS
jgi:hypothetical protein